jgi:hypothetical protein
VVSHMRPDQRIQCPLQVQGRFSLCPSSSFLRVLLALKGFAFTAAEVVCLQEGLTAA